MLLTPKDLSFVGYTYKNFDAVKGLHSFGESIILIFGELRRQWCRCLHQQETPCYQNGQPVMWIFGYAYLFSLGCSSKSACLAVLAEFIPVKPGQVYSSI